MRHAVYNHHRALKIWWQLFPQVILSSVFSGLIEAVSPLATLYLSARLIAELAGSRNMNALTYWVILILAVQLGVELLRSLCERWKKYAMNIAELIEREPFKEKLSQMDYSEIQRQYIYDLYSQIRENLRFTQLGLWKSIDIINELLMPGLFLVLGGLALSVRLFTAKVQVGSQLKFLNTPIFGLVMLTALITAAVLAAFLRGKANQYLTDFAENARFGNRLFSFFTATSVNRECALDVRLYEQETKILEPMNARYSTFNLKGEFGKLMFGKFGPFVAFSTIVTAMLTGFIYLFVCLKAWGGAYGVGEMTQYVGAITQSFLGVVWLLQAFAMIKANSPFLDKTFELLDVPNKMYQGSLTTEKRADRKYEIEFRNVSFRYPDTDIEVLHHVNLKFKIGARLAVVGQNGSGKTTFIKLLCRLYDPTEGQILLNGIDIRKYNYKDYMDIFSVVFQDFKLFPLPLGQNVACAAAYDKKRVAQCLRDAGWNEKYDLDTVLYKELDKEGVELSGGEAQKVAIARALYKDAPFIILDEPTAALDPMTEAEIYEKFDQIVTDKTAVYISHRLSSCQFCDEIAVFDRGSIVQFGTHESLLADSEGKYYELWNAQAQYYTE